ncbi:ribonuclease HI family protein [Humibacter ginsenosidimutans]|uniref:Ribonuclease H n=1 Tax=Humibacter ginsenosidimutans TaxID=2599293 RepID=A0A5B8M187_9MICO|nr:ribonuclease HI family protein [Humibacter ginsenosidimutans]QDZ13689.1 ribonuclease HI family protein [Humibacter ginsenosidimutans]
MTITAAADGSALGNPGPAGWAWYVDDSTWAAGGWPHGTNNQGELMAVIDLLESTADEDDDLVILCDSQYVINAVTKWMPGWKRKGWRKADGSPVQNLDLLKRLDDALVGRSYAFEWVRGHTGHELNEAADTRARAAATAYQKKSLPDEGPGWQGATVVSGTAAERENDRIATEAPAAQQDPFGDGLFGDDLLDDETDLDAVVRLERELLDPGVRADSARVAALLHPDFEEIGRSGRLWGRDTLIEELDGEQPSDVALEVLGADEPAAGTVLLTLRTTGVSGATLRSSLWVRDGERWRLRFHQGTPEA